MAIRPFTLKLKRKRRQGYTMHMLFYVFTPLGGVALSGRRDLQHSALPDGFGLPRQELPRQREADVRFDVPRPQLSGVSR